MLTSTWMWCALFPLWYTCTSTSPKAVTALWLDYAMDKKGTSLIMRLNNLSMHSTSVSQRPTGTSRSSKYRRKHKSIEEESEEKHSQKLHKRPSSPVQVVGFQLCDAYVVMETTSGKTNSLLYPEPDWPRSKDHPVLRHLQALSVGTNRWVRNRVVREGARDSRVHEALVALLTAFRIDIQFCYELKF